MTSTSCTRSIVGHYTWTSSTASAIGHARRRESQQSRLELRTNRAGFSAAPRVPASTARAARTRASAAYAAAATARGRSVSAWTTYAASAGQRSPREREPERQSNAPPKSSRLYAGDDECACDDERHKPPRPCGAYIDPDRGRGGDRSDRERPERSVQDPGPKRPAVKLVEGACADCHRQRERGERSEHSASTKTATPASSDGDVERCHSRVRRMQQRLVIARAAARQRVERGSRSVAQAPLPHTTTPPPRLRPARLASPSPAARKSASDLVLRPKPRMLGPRKHPTSCQPGEIRASGARAGRSGPRAPRAGARNRAAPRTRALRRCRRAAPRAPARAPSRQGRRRSAVGT